MARNNIVRSKGPCEIELDDGVTPFTFKDFLGNVEYTLNQGLAEILVERHGTLPIDHVSTGYDPIEITMPLAEAEKADIEKYIGIEANGLKTDIFNDVGSSLVYDKTTYKVTLKPLVNGIADTDEDSYTIFYNCSAPVINLTQAYAANADQRIFNATIKVYPPDDHSAIMSYGKNIV